MRNGSIGGLVFLTVALTLALGLFASAEGTPLSVAVSYTIPSLDPAATTSGLAHMVIDNVAERLIRFVPGTNDLEPELATSWESSTDLKTWTLYLREGVRFSDGTSFDANAVLANFERYKGVGKAPYGQTLMNVAQVDVLEPYLVQFTLAEPDFSFSYKLAGCAGLSIESPKAIAAHQTADDPWGENWFHDHIVGTGPYKLDQWKKTENVILVKNDDYWRGWEGPEPDRVIVRIVPEYASRKFLLSRGDVDIIGAVPSQDASVIEALPDAHVYIAKTTHIILNCFNFNKRIWQDSRLREAMAWSYPYKDAVESLVGAVPLQGPMASDVAGHNDDLLVYYTDLDKARELLREAGYGPGDLSITFFYWNADHIKTLTELWLANLNQIGVRLEPQALEWSEFYPFEGARDKPCDMWNVETWPDYPVGEEYLATLYEDDEYVQSINPGGWKNEVFNELCVLTRKVGDEAVRNYLYMAQQQLIMNELVCIPVAQISDVLGVSDSVSGIATSPAFGARGLHFYEMRKAQ